MTNLWRTHNGLVQLAEGQGWRVPTLDTSRDDVQARLARVSAWSAVARLVAARLRIPLSWLLGFIYVESGGNPRAEGLDGERGLIQVMPSTAKHLGRDPERLFEPEYNLETGGELIAQHRTSGFDLPETASAYNAGTGMNGRPYPSEKSPWGMRESPEYINRIVAATNHFTRANVGRSSAAGLGFLFLSGTLLYFLHRRRPGAQPRRSP